MGSAGASRKLNRAEIACATAWCPASNSEIGCRALPTRWAGKRGDCVRGWPGLLRFGVCSVRPPLSWGTQLGIPPRRQGYDRRVMSVCVSRAKGEWVRPRARASAEKKTAHTRSKQQRTWREYHTVAAVAANEAVECGNRRLSPSIFSLQTHGQAQAIATQPKLGTAAAWRRVRSNRSNSDMECGRAEGVRKMRRGKCPAL